MRDACERAPATFDVAGKMEKWCKDAGFVEVTQKIFKIPLGPWPKDKHEKTVGSYNLANMLNACLSATLANQKKKKKKYQKYLVPLAGVQPSILGITTTKHIRAAKQTAAPQSSKSPNARGEMHEYALLSFILYQCIGELKLLKGP
ncbi:hypothetical protein ABW20_dc0103382 [Dactylellina cionopaga]|nr:hypothetical protein ABW20_dc0103382 [Dactylellina cionopaga]